MLQNVVESKMSVYDFVSWYKNRMETCSRCVTVYRVFFLLTGLDWNGVTRYQGTTISSLREPWAKNGSSLSLSLSLSKNGHRRRPLPNMRAFLLWFFPSWPVFTGFLPSFFLGYYGFFRVLPRFCLGLLGCTGLYIVLLGYFWACIGFSLGFT